MPRVQKRTARNDIWRDGTKIPDQRTKSGFRRDRSQPGGPDDVILVPKGTEYYTWKFRYGGQRISLTPPKPQDLTQSEYLSAVYELNERLANYSYDSDGEEALTEIYDEIETLKGEVEERRENMPEGLRDSPTGELLEQRVNSLEEALEEIQAVIDELDSKPEEEDYKDEEEPDGDVQADAQERYDMALEEWTDDINTKVVNIQINID